MPWPGYGAHFRWAQLRAALQRLEQRQDLARPWQEHEDRIAPPLPATTRSYRYAAATQLLLQVIIGAVTPVVPSVLAVALELPRRRGRAAAAKSHASQRCQQETRKPRHGEQPTKASCAYTHTRNKA